MNVYVQLSSACYVSISDEFVGENPINRLEQSMGLYRKSNFSREYWGLWLTFIFVQSSKNVVTISWLQSMAAKTLGPIAWLMPILIAITACSSFNSGMMVASR